MFADGGVRELVLESLSNIEQLIENKLGDDSVKLFNKRHRYEKFKSESTHLLSQLHEELDVIKQEKFQLIEDLRNEKNTSEELRCQMAE